MTGKKFLHWYSFYFLLASFNIISVVVSLSLNHYVIDTHETTVERTKEFAAVQKKILRLSYLGTLMSKPGNEVFASTNVEAEKNNFLLNKSAFDDYLSEVSTELDKKLKNEPYAAS